MGRAPGQGQHWAVVDGGGYFGVGGGSIRSGGTWEAARCAAGKARNKIKESGCGAAFGYAGVGIEAGGDWFRDGAEMKTRAGEKRSRGAKRTAAGRAPGAGQYRAVVGASEREVDRFGCAARWVGREWSAADGCPGQGNIGRLWMGAGASEREAGWFSCAGRGKQCGARRKVRNKTKVSGWGATFGGRLWGGFRRVGTISGSAAFGCEVLRLATGGCVVGRMLLWAGERRSGRLRAGRRGRNNIGRRGRFGAGGGLIRSAGVWEAARCVGGKGGE